jgi:hypothetical protein
MNLDRPIDAILADLAAAPDAPEPAKGETVSPLAPAPSSWLDYSAPPGDPLEWLRPEPTDPQAEAIRRIVAALREAERQRQAEREQRIRQIVRDHLLLRRLLAEPTPEERRSRPMGPPVEPGSIRTSPHGWYFHKGG